MGRVTLFNSVFAKASGLESKAKQALPFLIKNQKNVIFDTSMQKSLADIRSYLRNPLTELYQKIIDGDKLNQFTIMSFDNVSVDIPTILTLNDVTVDGKAIGVELPDFLNKPWINLTPFIGKRDSYNGMLYINDAPAMCGLFVRGALSVSYNDSDNWLPPKLSSFIVESYSMTLASLIAKPYKLTYEDLKFVQTLFAARMAQLVGDTHDDLVTPPLLYRCPFLGSALDIKDRLDRIQHLRDNDGDSILTIRNIVDILNKTIPRLSEYKESYLYRAVSAAPLDGQSMLFGVDYPPYWTYLLLKVASGIKNPILSNEFKQSNLKNKLNNFVSAFIVSSGIIDKLTR